MLKILMVRHISKYYLIREIDIAAEHVSEKEAFEKLIQEQVEHARKRMSKFSIMTF